MVGDKNDRKWEVSGWLGLLTTGLQYISFRDDSDSNIQLKARELIERIKNQASAPPAEITSTAGLTPTTRSTSAPVMLFESIRKKYLRDDRIKRMVNENKSFPIEQSYTNLAMVETKEQQEKEKKLQGQNKENGSEQDSKQNNDLKQHNDKILGTYEEIYGVKTSIDVTDIFKKCKDQIKKVLVLGRAGIGKSTFCQYATYRWAKGEIWSQYDLVVLIRLRRLTDSRYRSGENYSPVDLLKKEYFPFDDLSNEDKQRFKQQCDTGKVLWILDGYDEFGQNIPDNLRDAFDHVLETQHHILTSRPYAISLSYDVQMEIIGFTNGNIKKYIKGFFDQIKDEIPNASSEGENLIHFLETNSSIWGVAHIPVNLELICSLWGDTDLSRKKTLTMTNLYDNITEWLCRRYLTKQNINHTQMRKKIVYDQCNKEMRFLETLAFNAMECNEIILPPALLEETEEETSCNLDDHPQLLNFGILRSYDDKPTGIQTQAEKQYYFIHLSFQEHFAARHLLKTLKTPGKSKATSFINTHKYNRRFLYVFIFASGLLAQSEYKSCMEVFWATVQGEPLDLVGLAHIKLITECLDALAGQTVFRQSTDLMKSVSQWFGICISTKSNIIIKSLLESFARTTNLCNNSILQNKLFELLHIQDQDLKTVSWIISKLPIQEPIPKLVSELNNLIRDEDSRVRRNACLALGNIYEKGATEEVITVLINALQDKSSDVKGFACHALGKMVEQTATKEVISALTDALRDKDSFVTKYACLALAKMDKKGVAKEMISALINALQDENPHVRGHACIALGGMGEKAATKEVISALTDALLDKHYFLTEYACDALGKMDEKGAREAVISAIINALRAKSSNVSEYEHNSLVYIDVKVAARVVIPALINALRHEDSHLRRYACDTLKKMGEKAATKKVISTLTTALRDENSDVRQCACEALGEMGEKAATKKVISALIYVLWDADSDVRRHACDALRKMGEKVATKEMISALTNALRDEDSDVRGYACRALGEMGEKATTEKVISALINTLSNRNSGVIRFACEALGKIGEKAATTEVISALINVLWNEDPDVRGYACLALGEMGENAATPEVIFALINVRRNTNLGVRNYACDALGKMREKAATKQVISALINEFRDEKAYVRECACLALGKMGEKAATKEVISTLIRTLRDENPDVRGYACRAIGKMGEKAATEEVISALINALRDEDSAVRRSTCYVFVNMGEKVATKEVIFALVSALRDDNFYVRRHACGALAKMGEKATTEEVISALIDALRDEDSAVKRYACNTLGEMGEKAGTEEVISALSNAVHDDDSGVRGYACLALGRMGEKAATKEVISSLINALRGLHSDVTQHAGGVLRKMGEKVATEEVISVLIDALQDEHSAVRLYASDALQLAFGSHCARKQWNTLMLSKLHLAIRQCSDIELKLLPPDRLIKVYLETENDAWLPLVTYVALLQGVAVTLVEDKITIHYMSEVMELPGSSPGLMKSLGNAFIKQRKEFQINSVASLQTEKKNLEE